MLQKYTKQLSFLLVIVLLLAVSSQIASADSDILLPVTHLQWNYQGPVSQAGDGTQSGENYVKNPSSPICSTATTSGNDVNIDCENSGPHNETSIAVNPINGKNIIAGANDYQLKLSSGGAVNETTFSRATVSFDGGKTWTTYPVDYNGYTSTGDPALAFDADGTAYYATLGFSWSQGNGGATTADVLVATSGDGGKTWSSPTRIANGSGSEGSVGIFNDKEYIAAWGHGNAIVTWTVFNDGQKGSYINSPIYARVTHDGGLTWSAAQQISGSATFCTGISTPTACDQDQVSVPTIAADGSIYVAFENTSDMVNFRDQYLVVKVDPATGSLVSGPYKVADLIDGATDYPVYAGRQTYQDSLFRTWSAGNITADPTNASHLAVVWSDMRNSQLPAPTDPYQAKTNSDVLVSQSNDGGKTWSAPVALAASGDQFMPWGAFDTHGLLRVGYFDRSYDRANHKYGYTLATQTKAGSTKFSYSKLSGVLSDPTTGDRWFARSVNPNFPRATAFLGDYSGIAATPTGGIVALWTDMRDPATFAGVTASGQYAYFGVHS